MLIEGMDGRLLVVSVSDPRYAKHSARLGNGTRLDVKEDLWQTPEHRQMAAKVGDPVPSGPRFYVTDVYLPSGERIEPRNAALPDVFRLANGEVIINYVCHAPKDN